MYYLLQNNDTERRVLSFPLASRAHDINVYTEALKRYHAQNRSKILHFFVIFCCCAICSGRRSVPLYFNLKYTILLFACGLKWAFYFANISLKFHFIKWNKWAGRYTEPEIPNFFKYISMGRMGRIARIVDRFFSEGQNILYIYIAFWSNLFKKKKNIIWLLYGIIMIIIDKSTFSERKRILLSG